MSAPFFSICIPNYNYEAFIGRTISSVLAQSFNDFEIVIADNASSDKSVEVIRSFSDPRVKVRVNRWNVGFSANLDRAAEMACGKYMIMLSSDDSLTPEALATYAQVLRAIDTSDQEKVVVSSPPTVIDTVDHELGYRGVDMKFWSIAKQDPDLTSKLAVPVLIADPARLLARALKLLRNPLPFTPTCYPRALYEAVEGYGGGRMISPDKWFNWKLLSVANQAIMIDAPLFRYRWHSSNQAAQQAKSGSLKHLVDQYANTIEIPRAVLDRAGLTQTDIIAAFVEHDIALRNLERMAEGNRTLAARGARFGLAVYPSECRKNWKVWALRSLLTAGPIGTIIARVLNSWAHGRWALAHGASRPQRLRAK